MVTKRETDNILAIVREVVDAYISKYTPGEIVLAHFEDECMSSYSGLQPVQQGTIRKLVKAVSAAVSQKEQAGNIVYPDGNVLVSTNSTGATFYAPDGSVVMTVNVDGIVMPKDFSVMGNLELGADAEQLIEDLIDDHMATDADADIMLRELWAE